MAHYIVYGTLKQGYGNHYLLQDEGVTFIGQVQTPPVYTLFDGGFPIVERGGNTSIKGELYEVTDERTIENLNRLEGCTGEQGHPNNWYDIDFVELDNGIVANMYVMDEGKGGRRTIINDGEWKR